MTEYNARIEYRTRESVDDHLLTELAPYHPATGRSLGGWVEVTFTVPAETLRQATVTALAIAGAAYDAEPIAIEVLPTAEFDARLGLAPLPEVVSVTEAAKKLGVSRQAVLQRLESGSLPGTKAGGTWVIPADAVLSPQERRERLEAGHAEQMAAAPAMQQRPRP
jgi:excisionase family DNA binding protein